MQKSPYTYREGLNDGLPIALGYLFVSMSFGIAAVNYGIPVLHTILISLTNLTSAGQVAGVEILKDVSVFAVSAMEMFLTQLVINLRYSLMGITLSQRLDDSFSTGKRFLLSYFITDEIFCIAAAKQHFIGTRYFLGLATLPLLGWTFGTSIGALVASWMPVSISNLFGIAIYAMFICLVLPVAQERKGVRLCALLAVIISCVIRYVPLFSSISSGFSIIICALIASCVCALLLPADEAEEEGER